MTAAFYPITNGTTVPADGYFEIPGNFTALFVTGFDFVAIDSGSGSPPVSDFSSFTVAHSTNFNGKTQIYPASGSPVGSPITLGSPIPAGPTPSGQWVTLAGGAYTLEFSDTTKPSLFIQVATLNQQTDLKYPGRASLNYGENINENFLHLLENFASPTAPQTPIEGELWYDNSNEILYICKTGSPQEWEVVYGGKAYDEIILSGSPPSSTVNTTNVNTKTKTSTTSYQQVFLNGILQREGATGNYTVTGLKQITFDVSVTLNTGDEVLIYQL